MKQEHFEDFDVPESVLNYIRLMFASVNDHVSQKISKIPNVPEESLDISFIDKLSDYSGPVTVEPSWAVQIATHFIGSIRHYRRYEIADIGVVIIFKYSSEIIGRKLVLLQSKRLYPKNFRVTELEDFDYQLGLGMVVRDASHEVAIVTPVKYEFDTTSKYGALKKASHQCEAIQDHFKDTRIAVHYMMYNPLILPWTIDHPLTLPESNLPTRTFGTRIIESSEVHKVMDGSSDDSPLRLSDLLQDKPTGELTFGWTLEDFFDEVVSCREGFRFSRDRDEGIRKLFNRKSGPIFCVVEITIENSLAG